MRIALCHIIFSLCIFIFSMNSAFAFSVDSVRLGAHPDKHRIVLDLSSVADYRAFMLGDPYRLVIDLPDFEWEAGRLSGLAPLGITNVRQGNVKPGISRVVFDLEKPAVIRSAFLLPQQGERPNRLVLDYSFTSETTYNREKSKILGTLNVEQAIAQQEARYAGAAPPLTKRKTKREKPLIVIDPGHGGVDPGAIGANGVFEKNVTLALSKELKKQLESTGKYRVMLTREKDIFIKLHHRVAFARKHEADLFISVHADSLKRSNVRGASVYTLSETASDKQTARLAARENKADLIAGIDLNVEDDDVANILLNLSMRDTMNQSKFFANTLVDRLNSGGIQILENPHRYAGFAVLKAPDIPSVLVEAGFLSNRREANLLTQPNHRRKIALSLKAGINTYFDRVAMNENS